MSKESGSIKNNEYLSHELYSDEEKLEIPINDEFSTKIQESKLLHKESIYLIVALEDSVRQTLILGACCSDIKYKSSQGTDSKLPDDRLEKINYAELASDNHKIAKMNSDRNYITCVSIKIYLDLQKNKNFASLSIELTDIAAKTYQTMAQVLQHNENRSTLKNLQTQYNREIRLNKSTLQNCDIQIHRLQDEISDEKWNCKIKEEYITEWQNAKKDQHNLKLFNTEKLLSDELKETKIKIEQEILVNQEIEKFMHMRMQELSDDVKFWKNKYEVEFKDIKEKICEMEKMRQIQIEKMKSLQKLLDDHKREMDNWLSFVEERNRKLEYERLLQRSAVLLQAWWRGLMVRRRLAAKLAKDSKRKSAKKKK